MRPASIGQHVGEVLISFSLFTSTYIHNVYLLNYVPPLIDKVHSSGTSIHLPHLYVPPLTVLSAARSQFDAAVNPFLAKILATILPL